MRLSKLQLTCFGQPHARDPTFLSTIFVEGFQEGLAATIKHEACWVRWNYMGLERLAGAF